MIVAPIASSLPSVAAVSRTARVVKRALRPNSRTSGPGGGDPEGAFAAMKTPEEASSPATQEALAKLELGG